MKTGNTLFSETTLVELAKYGKDLANGEESRLLAEAQDWCRQVDSLDTRLRKEARLEASFIKKILCETFGHVLPGEAAQFSLIPKDDTQSGIPDIKAGRFRGDQSYYQVKPKYLLELKGPDTLDFRKPQTSRRDKKSAVEQVVSDMFVEDDQCEFAIVTNLIDFEIFSRRFADKKSHRLSLRDLGNSDQLHLFLALLHKDSILLNPRTITLEFKRIEEEKKRLSKDFYKTFKHVRQKLLSEVEKSVPDEDVNPLATRLLSQIIFTLYGETIAILPKNCLIGLLELEDYAWSVYKKFCKALDRGGKVESVTLFGYNGGLFAPHKLFDYDLSPAVLKAIKPLLEFRFKDRKQRPLNKDEVRDALGRVLEHALEVNEEERLYNFTREGKFADARKKQAARNERQSKGVFYTPRFVTKYMVERILEELKAAGANVSKTTWYDPACGSGAFLLEVFDQLVTFEMQKSGLRPDMLGRKDNFERVLSQIELDVLRRVKGADIDPLAVGISQLNLSMNCCRPYEKLPTLGSTLKEQDSLFDDNGRKYDVVIANPPYMQWRYIPENYRDWLSKDRSYKDLAADSADYSAFFFKQAAQSLKPGGLLAFIATNKLLSSKQAEKFRRWLLTEFEIIELLDFRKKIFQGTDVETCVYLLRKKKATAGNYKYGDVFSFKRSDGHLERTDVNKVPISIVKQTPYRTIPTRTSPALLKIHEWYRQNRSKFTQLNQLAKPKSGMRITDIPSADVLDTKPKGVTLLQYEALYDGTCLSQASKRFTGQIRWVARNSERIASWREDLKDCDSFVIVKELSSHPAAVAVARRCPAILNSLQVIPLPSGGVTGASLADWIKSPFVETLVELWFGPNRHHATQRWKNVYLGQVPIPATGRFVGLLPNWVVKECLCYLDGKYRDEPDTSERKAS